MVQFGRWSKLNIENRMKVKVHNYRKKKSDKNENTPNLRGFKVRSSISLRNQLRCLVG